MTAGGNGGKSNGAAIGLEAQDRKRGLFTQGASEVVPAATKAPTERGASEKPPPAESCKFEMSKCGKDVRGLGQVQIRKGLFYPDALTAKQWRPFNTVAGDRGRRGGLKRHDTNLSQNVSAEQESSLLMICT